MRKVSGSESWDSRRVSIGHAAHAAEREISTPLQSRAMIQASRFEGKVALMREPYAEASFSAARKPPPGALPTVSRAPISSASPFTNASPIPVPWVRRVSSFSPR